MVRHSPAYFTRHIYICCRSDLVIAHLSLICPLRQCVCVWSKDNDCIDQRRPQWVVLFRQGWEKTRGREKREKESRGQNGMPSVATRLIALANQISIFGCRLPAPCRLSKSNLLPRFYRLSCLRCFLPSSSPRSCSKLSSLAHASQTCGRWPPKPGGGNTASTFWVIQLTCGELLEWDIRPCSSYCHKLMCKQIKRNKLNAEASVQGMRGHWMV